MNGNSTLTGDNEEKGDAARNLVFVKTSVKKKKRTILLNPAQIWHS